MVHHHQETAQLLLESGAAWASGLNVPWFLAGAGLGVPAAVGTVSTGDSKLLSLITTLGGIIGGVAADRLSTTAFDNLAGAEIGCYDVLTKGVGPACLLLVVLSRTLRSEPSVAVKPAAAVAVASLLLEPLFSAYVLGTGGGIIAGGTSRPFYVTITLGGVTAKTSARSGFSPSFTEVFPLGCDCPIRGAFLTIAVVDSFETGRSSRGDRIVGEVHLPLDAAQLVPGTGRSSNGGDPSYIPSSGGGGGGGGGSGVAYRLSGDWELQGALGGTLGGARVGADVVIHGPPSPSSAAGRLRRRRESVGWYAR